MPLQYSIDIVTVLKSSSNRLGVHYSAKVYESCTKSSRTQALRDYSKSCVLNNNICKYFGCVILCF